MVACIIAVGSEEISEKVQKALFSAGFRWPMSGQSVVSTDAPFLAAWPDMEICAIRDSAYANDKIRGGRPLISAQDVIENPFQLDGAKKPVKEMTVAELEAKLGHPVKVVKG